MGFVHLDANPKDALVMIEQEIFLALLPLADPAERAARLGEACDGDQDLQQRVERLLQAHDQAGQFLQRPAAPLATIDFPRVAEGPGDTIGPYRLLQQIGEGGFGVVYMAEQLAPVRRKVALKIIKPGMDTREVIARFESERQALALMDHPNIARVLDAGATASGRPYFVMELVKGLPITEFADKNRLTIEQRLPLFVDVCRAVQHAHQKGVIHRDLKPTNVMVTLHDGRPVAKVIDFGVAKATSQQLTQRTLFTAYGQMIGTPAYMSPEQAEMSGLDIDTRSDIYSLGVLLYELLTGTTPLELERLRAAGFAEMQRLIRDEEPQRPSTRFSTLGAQATALASSRGTDVKRLGQFLRGDLDWIVMKSLEKDRNRRYETPGAFAADIERFLNNDAITARPPSAAYRLRKLVRRNAAAVAAVGAIAAVLLIGGIFSTIFGIQATRQAARAVDAERAAQQNLTEAQQTGQSLAAARENLRGTLYAAEMNLIQTYSEAGQYSRAAMLLERQRPTSDENDLRGWEWHYWQRLLARQKVRSIPVADFNRIASVRVLESIAGAVSFTSDGERVIAMIRPSANERTRLMTFDAETGRRISELVLRNPPGPSVIAGNSIPSVLSTSNDGARFAHVRASADQWQILVRDGQSGATIAALEPIDAPRFQTPLSTPLAISPDGNRVAQAYVNIPRLIARGEENRDPSPPLTPDVDSPGGPNVRFAPPSSTIEIFDATTGKKIIAPPAKGYGPVRMLWSADSQSLLIQLNSFYATSETRPQEASVALSYEFQLIDAQSGEQVWQRTGEMRQGNARAIQVRAWSPDGRLIAVATENRQESSPGSHIELWDAETGETLAILALPAKSTNINPHLVFSPDSQRLAHAAEHDLHVWDLREISDRQAEPLHLGAPAITLPNPHGPVRALAFNRDGREIRAVTGAAITAWDAALPIPSPAPQRRTLRGMVQFSPDASRLACVEVPGDITICDASTGQRISTLSRAAGRSFHLVSRIAVSHDGRHVALGLMGPLAPHQPYGTSQHHATIELFDAEDGRALQVFDVGANVFQSDADNLHFHPDDRRLAMAVNASAGEPAARAQLRSWDLQKLEERPAVDLPWRRGRVLGCTSDGAAWVIVRGSRQQNQLLTVNVTTDELGTTRTFPGRIVLFEPHFNRVGVRQGRDLVFFDLDSGTELVRLLGIPGHGVIAFSPDGRRLALGARFAGANQSQIDIWSLESGYRLLTLVGPPNLGIMKFSGDGRRILARAAGWPAEYPSQSWDATSLPETDAP